MPGKIVLKKKPTIVIKKKPTIVIKKKTINPVLKEFLESNYMISTPTKAELRKIVNSYIADGRLQHPNRSRQYINLDDQLKTISGLTDDVVTVYILLDAIISNAGKLS